MSCQTVFAIVVAGSIYQSFDKPLVITSANDGHHSKNSKHYRGDAIDIRTRHLTSEEEQEIVTQLRHCLGRDYDVVQESNHIHIEYDPKRRD
ncbi:D-Ala-D-Ala carboxypeptidase family metallohydrolase [Pleionea sp. CnH1-48]|uniref:D-Ala-D-Ala carboxypeptidase family metallohydrolase n=1 Tax=Pleionea sp. CnH1-48 TaxID=2954494 RepID=UPI002097590C|nr:D-Ala-D-Ala carboxypeptidase family metallohydrolase [Pleionea sp. CnH1-48]MCO7225915.1 hypothetical protein [Pleionea sp. CnH1-48]